MDKPSIIAQVKTGRKQRIPMPVVNLINKQIGREFYSSALYKAMASWLNFNGYLDSAPVFEKYGDEELVHYNKFRQYLLDKDILPVTPGIEQPPQSFTDLVDIIYKSYDHECQVTDWLNEISACAHENSDYTSAQLLDWFLNEQIEEETKFKSIIDYWEVISKNVDNRGLALAELDKMIGEQNEDN